VGVYPTWTARTIGEAINVANWCAEHGVDIIGFHRFSPVQGSWEKAPTEEEYRRTCDELRRWCVDRGDPLRVKFEGESLNNREPPDRKTDFADLEKALALFDMGHLTFPVDRNRSGADAFMTCAAPNEYVEISLEGQISACCRSQDVALGYATTVDNFCNVWLGNNYGKIRRSLRRDESGPYPLSNCLGCVKFFAPNEAGERRAVDYAKHDGDEPNRLHFDESDLLPIEVIQKEDGYCHITAFPLGISVDDFELWENDRPLGPAGCLHDDIRRNGGGRYHIGATSVYFSTSDRTDARRNGRTYSLRRTVKTILARESDHRDIKGFFEPAAGGGAPDSDAGG